MSSQGTEIERPRSREAAPRATLPRSSPRSTLAFGKENGA
jgi:hypothetical protein